MTAAWPYHSGTCPVTATGHNGPCTCGTDGPAAASKPGPGNPAPSPMGRPASEAAGTGASSAAPVHGFGLIVSPQPHLTEDRVLYAEVVPAGSRWLPWPGRTSRWWYEVHASHAPDEHGVGSTTYAYVDGGSGGGFTLRSCIAKAMEAVGRFAEEAESNGD